MLEVEGAILAGGRSRRMGRDKSALVVGDVPVLERIGSAMAPIATRVRVMGDRVADPRGYQLQGDLRAGLGPLSGIHSALATAQAPAVLVVACDLPLVTTEFLRGLCELLEDGADAVVPRWSGRAVPVCAVYRTACLAPLESFLDRGELKARRFVAALDTLYPGKDVLERLDPDGVCLRNVNTPEDLEQARAIADRERG